jgi:hypothetical protein
MLFNFRPGKKQSRRGSRARVHPWPRVRVFLEALEDRCLPSNIHTVMNTGDNGGVNPAPNAGTGTLRQAIIDANADPDPGATDLINFAIGYGQQTIALVSPLPAITHPTVLDATSQPGFFFFLPPVIELSGANMSTGGGGLYISANGCTVKGFLIDHFAYDGILLSGANNCVIGAATLESGPATRSSPTAATA